MMIRKAVIEDAPALAAIMKTTFDVEQQRWSPGSTVQDNNLRPPGYDSAEIHTYFIQQAYYFVIEMDGQIIGGACVDYPGRRHARIDRIFVDPAFQGCGIGSKVLAFLEREFPAVAVWKLETSGKQLNNHHFYEKAGYSRIYESEMEFGYEMHTAVSAENVELAAQFKDQSLPKAEFENCLMSDADFYNMNLEKACFNNSNLSGSLFTDCNLSGSKFTNLNLTDTLLSNLRLTGSQIFGCDLSNVDIRHCNTEGLRIEGILLEDLLVAYYKGRE